MVFDTNLDFSGLAFFNDYVYVVKIEKNNTVNVHTINKIDLFL